MGRQIDFQWQIEDENVQREEFWREATATERPAARSSGELRLMARLGQLLTLLLVMLLATAGAPFSWRLQENRQLAAEINQVLEVEMRALRTDDRDLGSRLMEDRIALVEHRGWLDLWRIRQSQRRQISLEVVEVERLGDLALVTLRIVPPRTYWVSLPYQELRFYRHADGSWLQTVPPESFWGAPKRLEMGSLIFEYTERDAEAVEGAAAQLEATYARLRQAVGLPTRPAQPLTFTVEPRVVGTWSSRGTQIGVTSPTLYQIPEWVTPTGQLIDTVTDHLINKVLSELLHIDELYYSPEWYILLGGVRSWMRTHILEAPPYWQEEALQELRNRSQILFPLRLTDLDREGRIEPEERQLRFTVAEMAVAYIMDQQGMAHLPVFLRALRTHTSWEELLDDLYGQTVEQFTYGWNVYMVDEYRLLDEGQPAAAIQW